MILQKINQKKLSDGNELPSIGLGTWKLEGSKCTEVIKKALETGYNHIDTAEMYGNESEIGVALDRHDIDREKLFITSKVWPDNADKESMINSCKNSIKKLKSKYLDLYLLHWPRKDVDLQEVFASFKKLIEEEKIKSAGVSNFTIKHLKEALKAAKKHHIDITVNQVEFHPGLFQRELLEFCQKQGIQIVAYSPIGRGELLRDKTLQYIAKKHEKSVAQVSLRWALQKGLVIIPKSSSEKHLIENLNLFDFELDKEDMDSIDRMGNSNRMLNPGWIDFS